MILNDLMAEATRLNIAVVYEEMPMELFAADACFWTAPPKGRCLFINNRADSVFIAKALKRAIRYYRSIDDASRREERKKRFQIVK